MTLAYILYWPEYQKYEDIKGFYNHAWHTDDVDYQMVVVEKEWFDQNCKDGENHSYVGD